MRRIEFSKILLVLDYFILLILIITTISFAEVIDLTSFDIAWVAQLGVSTGFYYWKAKNENRIKIPFRVLRTLKPSMRNELDLTHIITTIIEKE